MASFGGGPFAGVRPGQPAQQQSGPQATPSSPGQPGAAQAGPSASFGATMGGPAGGGLMGATPATATPTPGAVGDVVIDSSTATFMQDVIDASFGAAVIVDFWAPWCGPCKQLGPMIEKIVREQQGKVRLVKINVDENQELARQMRIQSIPAVYAFKDGRPVDGFMGALPETQLRQFVDALAGGPSPAAQGLQAAMAEAEAMAKEGDLETAIAIYEEVLAQDENNVEAIAGLARVHLTAGALDQAKAALARYKPDGKTAEPPAIAGVRAQIELAEQSGAKAGELEALKSAVAQDPANHQARYDLALGLFAAGQPKEAVDELLAIIKRNRDWNEGEARKQLLKIFEAQGPTHEVTLYGRRQLSSILFS